MSTYDRCRTPRAKCNFGQHEINFGYEPALGAADTHTIYKNAAKEISSQEGMALTFMAKFNEREGNSCHVHLSVREADGGILFGDQPELFERFVAGQLACLRELTLCLAPNVNSYKRYAEGSFAPTSVAWGATTAHARCGWSATARRCGWRTAWRAATSTPTSRSRR